MNDFYKKVSLSIDRDFVGLAALIDGMNTSTIDIDIIKNILSNKIENTTDKELIFYKGLYEKINNSNLTDIFKEIDSHIYLKNRAKKESLVKDFDNRVAKSMKEKSFEDNGIGTSTNKYELLKKIMKEHIYVYSKKNNIAYLYLLNSTEEKKFKNDILNIEESLKNNSIGFKLIVVDRNNPIDKLTPKEKETFIDFFKNY